MAHMILGVDHVPGYRTLHKNSWENVVGLPSSDLGAQGFLVEVLGSAIHGKV